MREYSLSSKYLVLQKNNSDGSQNKYFHNGYLYKQDCIGMKGYVEHLVSQLLRCSTLPKSTYVYYEWCKVNGKYGCCSSNFLVDCEEFMSFSKICRVFCGGTLSADILRIATAKDRYMFLLELISKACHIDIICILINDFLIRYVNSK